MNILSFAPCAAKNLVPFCDLLAQMVHRRRDHIGARENTKTASELGTAMVLLIHKEFSVPPAQKYFITPF